MVQVFEFTDYRKYLDAALEKAGEAQKGVKSRFSEFLGFKPGYLSQVFKGQADLSLEQAARANRFLSHTQAESRYFVLLVNHARAGTPELRELFGEQITERRENFLNLKKRFKQKDELSEAEKNIYFSSWQYAAVHIAIAVPQLQTPDAISRYFKLDPKRVLEILSFLAKTGFAKQSTGKYLPGENWLHLGKDSPLATKNHVNWRLQAIQALENQRELDVHYTSTFNLAESDVFRVKSILVNALEQVRAVIKDSKEEKVYSLLVDFFGL